MKKKDYGFLRKRLSAALRNIRGDLTQREFSRRVGLTHGTVARIELEQVNVTLDTLEKICRSLDCDVNELFSKSGLAD